jgi:hypothetical protein
MSNWLIRLAAVFGGRPSGTPQGTDWRGRPLKPGAANAGASRDDLFGTIRPSPSHRSAEDACPPPDSTKEPTCTGSR